MAYRMLALVSGGLDSILAARVIQEQRVEVLPVHFLHPWGCGSQDAVRLITRQLGVEPRIVEAGEDFIAAVRNPRFGRGRNFNPCVDCRVFMFRSLFPLMAETGSEAIITGEVLGQRPMSQLRKKMILVDREAGLEGRVLRPLSAQRLPPTVPEIANIVDRQALFGFTGRSRAPQRELARRLGVSEYHTPAGGCNLTNPSFMPKLRDFLAHYPDAALTDARALNVGRHLRISPDLKLIVARNESEGRELEALHDSSEPVEMPRSVYIPDGFDGPTVLVCGPVGAEEEELIGGIILRYSRRQNPPEPGGFPLRVVCSGHTRRVFARNASPPDVVRRFLIADLTGSTRPCRDEVE